jgi:hypothetical protein
MAIVGTIGNVTLADDSGVAFPDRSTLGGKVMKLLETYGAKCPKIAKLYHDVSPVTAVIAGGGSTGALTIYKAKKIKVSKDLPGGAEEIAESILFELLNWKQGNFVTTAHDGIQSDATTPREAGKRIATTEASVAFEHAQLMDQLKAAGVPLSQFGERNRAAKGAKDLSEFVRLFLLMPHDANAPKNSEASLSSAQLYMYEAIENNPPDKVLAPAAVHAIGGDAPGWFEDFVNHTAKWIPDADSRCTVYVKFLDLAGESKLPVKAGFEFTHPMRQLANKPLSSTLQGYVKDRVLGKVRDKPADLDGKLKKIGFLA